MFSVVDALLNKPLDLPQVDRLVVVLERRPGQVLDWTPVSGANYADWRAAARSFDAMASALVASGLPAWRAARVEPLTAIRGE